MLAFALLLLGIAFAKKGSPSSSASVEVRLEGFGGGFFGGVGCLGFAEALELLPPPSPPESVSEWL